MRLVMMVEKRIMDVGFLCLVGWLDDDVLLTGLDGGLACLCFRSGRMGGSDALFIYFLNSPPG
jgi:hypothetical protein